MTEFTPEDDLKIEIDLRQRAANDITMRPVGIRPYVLIEVISADDDTLELGVEVGGGVDARPLSNLAEFIAATGEALSYYEVADDPDAEVQS